MTKETIVGKLLQAGNITAEEAIVLLQTKIVTVRPPAEKTDEQKEADRKKLQEELEKHIKQKRDGINPWQQPKNPYNPFNGKDLNLYVSNGSWGFK